MKGPEAGVRGGGEGNHRFPQRSLMPVGSWIRGPLAGGHSWPCQVSWMQNQAREPQVATGVLPTAPKAGAWSLGLHARAAWSRPAVRAL